MSICLAVVAAIALSTAAPHSTAAPSPSASAGLQAVQYVQVQYRNVFHKPDAGNVASQVMGSEIKNQIGSFVSNVLQQALMHANPILGFIASAIANRVTKKMMTRPPIHVNSKSNITVTAEFEATTTIAPARTRTDVGDISTIIQCDKQQIIVMDNTSKVYSTQSLNDSMNDADSEPAYGFGGGTPDLARQTIVAQPDDGTETIAGLLSHHDLITAPLTTGFGAAKTDLWFADIPMPNACSSMVKPPGLANAPLSAAAASTVRIPLRSVQWDEMDFSVPLPAPSSSSTPSSSPTPSSSSTPSSSPGVTASPIPYQDPVLGTPGIAWVETTSVTRFPYDSAYFDVPAGYTLATPEPSPSPS